MSVGELIDSIAWQSVSYRVVQVSLEQILEAIGEPGIDPMVRKTLYVMGTRSNMRLFLTDLANRGVHVWGIVNQTVQFSRLAMTTSVRKLEAELCGEE